MLSQALAPRRHPGAVHDPGKILCDLAISLALGGDCLADLATLRAEPGVFGLVASDPTVSRLITTLADNIDTTLAALDTARATARAAAWALAGDHASDNDISPDHPLIIDLDATLLTARSDKQNAAPTSDSIRHDGIRAAEHDRERPLSASAAPAQARNLVNLSYGVYGTTALRRGD